MLASGAEADAWTTLPPLPSTVPLGSAGLRAAEAWSKLPELLPLSSTARLVVAKGEAEAEAEAEASPPLPTCATRATLAPLLSRGRVGHAVVSLVHGVGYLLGNTVAGEAEQVVE